jgi:hypothetical protein
MYTIIKKEFHELDTSDKQLRKFGLFVGSVVLVLSGALALLWSKDIHEVIWALGATLVALAIILPRALLWPNYLWMGVAIVLGFFLGHIVLGLLFYVMVTPIGLLKRLFSSAKKTEDTYWIKREAGWTKESMERLF